ncbi:TauD/TfdA family dioxygenase [Micromonospora sp. NPDC000316]|uniref:TauD/TfdA family dioxygenase n=1 Tax=Micromonospora sp. NPDC000316 TaxID=3364216 RepID=UPI0036ADC946
MNGRPIPAPVDHTPEAVLGELAAHGAVLVRGAAAPRETFHALGDALMEPLRHEYRLTAERDVVPGDPTTTTVTRGTAGLPLHREASYLPGAPDLLTFHCVRPAAAHGLTTLCDGVAVLAALEPALRTRLERLEIVWETPVGPEHWPVLAGTSDRTAAIRSIRDWSAHLLPWQTIDATFEGDVMTVAFGTLCAPPTLFGGMPAFCTSLFVTDPEAGDYVEGRLRVRLADGAPFPGDVLRALRHVADRLTVAVPWRAGDTVLVDNTRFMHGRQAFDDPARNVLVRMGHLRQAWMPMPAVGEAIR